MARPLRLKFAGALYHVTSRGDRREDIYEGAADRTDFLSVLGEVCTRHNWVCHAYCLMSNRYHLLVENSDRRLSRGMRPKMAPDSIPVLALNKAQARITAVLVVCAVAMRVTDARRASSPELA